MPELTQEEKIKIFEKLPKELQNLIESEDTGAFLLYLQEKYGLDDDKTSLLSKIVGDIVLGITPTTALTQEINSKIISDTQTATSLAQELYNELLFPILIKTSALPTAIAPSTPYAPAPTPSAPLTQMTPADKYREPTSERSGIVDLRRIPPPTMPMPPAPLKPLTFIRPIESKPAHLIEAEPHKITIPSSDSYREPLEKTPAATKVEPPAVSPSTPLRTGPVEPPPQYIIRPPGLPPTDHPRDVLDLRKDKGEF